MTQSTIDGEVDEILLGYHLDYVTAENKFKRGHIDKREWDIRRKEALAKAAHAITNLIAQEANKARLQTAIDFATRLKLEFTKRDLSSDNMPKGYRKLTNEELITKVWGELTADKEQND